jgi:hypothetical protein
VAKKKEKKMKGEKTTKESQCKCTILLIYGYGSILL